MSQAWKGVLKAWFCSVKTAFSSRLFRLKKCRPCVMNKMGTDNVHTSRSPDFEQNQQAEITSSSWKTRSDRSVESKQCSGRSWSPFSIVRRVLFCMFADMIYALGKYRGGGLLGKPLSTFQLARTSLCNSAVTRKSTEYSEGNESTVENSQLTEEKKEEQKRILSKMRGHCNMAAVRFLGSVSALILFFNSLKAGFWASFGEFASIKYMLTLAK